MSRALRRAQENLEDMLLAVEHNFSVIHNMLRNSMNPERIELRRRIHEVNMEFIRMRASTMRQSFEQNLARLEIDRRRRRKRSDSVGSSYSDDEEYRFCRRTLLPSKPRRSTFTYSSSKRVPEKSKLTTGTLTPSPDSSTDSSSSSTSAGESPSFAKRKLSISAMEIMPFKRSMATSTHDAEFHHKF